MHGPVEHCIIVLGNNLKLFSNTGARMLDSIYNLALNYFEIALFGIKR